MDLQRLILGIWRNGSLQVSGACCRLQLTATIVVLLWICCSTRWGFVEATEPEPVEQYDAEGCTLSSAYGVWNDLSTCRAASVVYPTTEQEILHAVASAVRANQKIKVATASSHSIPSLACPGSPSGVILSTRNYTSIVDIDTKTLTVTAQGGIGLRPLINAIASKGLALPASPYWNGVTLAGLLATSSHGSSHFGKGGAVHEYVISMRLVTPAGADEGYAKVRVLNQGDVDLNSAKVSLGVLGVVSTVTLQLEPAFKRNVTLKVVQADDGLESAILRIAQHVEFGDVTWYPGLRQAVYRYEHRVPLQTPGEGKNNFIGFQPQVASLIASVRVSEETADATRDREFKCDLAFAQVSTLELLGYGCHQNGRDFTGFPVTGHHHHIMAAGGCQRSTRPSYFCPWDRRFPGLVFHECGAALPGCAIDGLCRCWKDEHCAPEKKSFCRPGRVYHDARVCRVEV